VSPSLPFVEHGTEARVSAMTPLDARVRGCARRLRGRFTLRTDRAKSFGVLMTKTVWHPMDA
jgi:hypothetical protein